MEIAKAAAFIIANWETITLIVTNIIALFVPPPKLTLLRRKK